MTSSIRTDLIRTDLIRIELLKLRTTPAVYVAGALTLVFGLIAVVTTILLGGKQGTPPVGSVANVSKALQVSGLTSMVLLVLGILVIAGEHRHRTIMGTYLAEPHRGRVLVAKLVTVGAIGAVVGAVMFGLALVVAVPLYAAKGVHTLPVDIGEMWWGCTLATACFGLLGVALGAVTRNTVGAIIGGLIWVQVVEVGLLQSLLPAAAKWLPTGAGVALTGGSSDPSSLLSPGVAAAVLVGWSLALCLVATRLASRQELR